jgi:segregation and condensation protein B
VERDEEKRILEALVLAGGEPLAPARLAKVVPGLTASRARELALELRAEYERDGRGFELVEVAGGFQLRTRPELAEWLQRLERERPARLSRAALETLAVVAYRQPATRAEVEHVRGVDCGPVLRSLLERHLVRIAGHRDAPGRPMLYGTTRRFLEVFGLASLDELPSLRDLEELVKSAAEAAEGTEGAGEEEPPGAAAEALPAEETEDEDDAGLAPSSRELH